MTPSQSAAVHWGQLLRVSLLPTALADILAGFALGSLSRGQLQIEWPLFVSSVCIYHGSMALNDWADFKEDSEHRPHRPLPSGRIKPGAALWTAVAMISGGVLIAASLSLPLGAWMLGIASLAIGYNIWLRGRLSGPLSLGMCRGMHLAAPVILIAPGELAQHSLLFVGYGVYVFTLSSLARMETSTTAELKQTPRSLIFVIAAAFAAPLLWAASDLDSIRRGLVTVFSVVGAGALVRHAIGGAAWTPARVQACVGVSLRLLLVYTASCALTGLPPYAWIAAPLILAGYPLAHGLRKVFPPT